MGKVKQTKPSKNYSSLLISLDVLDIEDPQKSNGVRDNEKLVTEHFLSTVARNEFNMPWIEDHRILPSNFYLAEKRFYDILKKLRNENLFDDYYQIFNDWLQEGIIEQVEGSVDTSKDIGYYLPHHPVIKFSSATTKIRPVFDATSHGKGQPLQSMLRKGT